MIRHSAPRSRRDTNPCSSSRSRNVSLFPPWKSPTQVGKSWATFRADLHSWASLCWPEKAQGSAAWRESCWNTSLSWTTSSSRLSSECWVNSLPRFPHFLLGCSVEAAMASWDWDSWRGCWEEGRGRRPSWARRVPDKGPCPGLSSWTRASSWTLEMARLACRMGLASGGHRCCWCHCEHGDRCWCDHCCLSMERCETVVRPSS